MKNRIKSFDVSFEFWYFLYFAVSILVQLDIETRLKLRYQIKHVNICFSRPLESKQLLIGLIFVHMVGSGLSPHVMSLLKALQAQTTLS